jgi:hypothetical protein
MKKNIEEYYRIIYDDADNKKWCIELLKPCDPFHEILYSYGKFSIVAKDENDSNPKFNYEIDILYVPERLRGVNLPDEKQNEMELLIANILFDIIGKNVDKTKNKDGKLYLELSRETNER